MPSKLAQKLNIVMFIATSISCYQGARLGFLWLGPAILVLHWALFLPTTPYKARRIAIALFVGLAGFILDSTLIGAGVFGVQEETRLVFPAPLCPEWILTLWLNFGFMLYTLHVLLRQNRFIGPITGAIFSFVIMGNASYMGLVHFATPTVLGYFIVAAIWAVLVPVLAFVTNRIMGEESHVVSAK